MKDVMFFLPNLIAPKPDLKYLSNFWPLVIFFSTNMKKGNAAFGCKSFSTFVKCAKVLCISTPFFERSQFCLIFFSFGSLQGKEDPLVRCKALWAGVFVEGIEDDEKTPISEKNTDVPSEASSIP